MAKQVYVRTFMIEHINQASLRQLRVNIPIAINFDDVEEKNAIFKSLTTNHRLPRKYMEENETLETVKKVISLLDVSLARYSDGTVYVSVLSKKMLPTDANERISKLQQDLNIVSIE